MSTATRHPALSPRHIDAGERRTRIVAVIGALAATLAVWLLAHTVAGIDLAVRSGGVVRHVGVGSVALATLLASLAAWGVRPAVEHLATRPRRTWNAVAAATLLVSLAGPIALAQTPAAAAALVSMHLSAAGVLIRAMASR